MDIQQTHFALFELPERFALDEAVLTRAYQRLQTQVHPDRFASATPAEQRVAMQWATQVNEAFRTLKDPLLRARYLCELHGIDLAVESNTHMPASFLMEQLEWREALDEAREDGNEEALLGLETRLREAISTALAETALALDEKHDYVAAADAIRRLMFLSKTREDIGQALDRLAS